MIYKIGSIIFFFKQKTAYESRISDWSSDVCSAARHVPQSDSRPPLRERLSVLGDWRRPPPASNNYAKRDSGRQRSSGSRRQPLFWSENAGKQECGPVEQTQDDRRETRTTERLRLAELRVGYECVRR